MKRALRLMLLISTYDKNINSQNNVFFRLRIGNELVPIWEGSLLQLISGIVENHLTEEWRKLVALLNREEETPEVYCTNTPPFPTLPPSRKWKICSEVTQQNPHRK
jgi:hypothetical protein